jgi:hypothetical protein
MSQLAAGDPNALFTDNQMQALMKLVNQRELLTEVALCLESLVFQLL